MPLTDELIQRKDCLPGVTRNARWLQRNEIAIYRRVSGAGFHQHALADIPRAQKRRPAACAPIMKKLAITSGVTVKRPGRSHPGDYLFAVVSGDIAKPVCRAPQKLF
jgi:hypothetical protein